MSDKPNSKPSSKAFWALISGPYTLVMLWGMYQEGTLLHYLQLALVWLVLLGLPMTLFLFWPSEKCRR